MHLNLSRDVTKNNAMWVKHELQVINSKVWAKMDAISVSKLDLSNFYLAHFQALSP